MGIKIVPAATPEALKSAPVGTTLEIVTFEFPLFLSVTLDVLFWPTVTFPKLRLDGFAPRRRVDAVPVPLKGITSGEPGALLVIEILPLALPADVGENVAVKEVFCPAFSVSGVDNPVILKPVPDATP